MSRVTPVDQTVIVIVSSLSSEVSGMPGRRGIGFEEQLVAGYYSKGVSSTVVDLWCLQKTLVKIGVSTFNSLKQPKFCPNIHLKPWFLTNFLSLFQGFRRMLACLTTIECIPTRWLKWPWPTFWPWPSLGWSPFSNPWVERSPFQTSGHRCRRLLGTWSSKNMFMHQLASPIWKFAECEQVSTLLTSELTILASSCYVVKLKNQNAVLESLPPGDFEDSGGFKKTAPWLLGSEKYHAKNPNRSRPSPI